MEKQGRREVSRDVVRGLECLTCFTHRVGAGLEELYTPTVADVGAWVMHGVRPTRRRQCRRLCHDWFSADPLHTSTFHKDSSQFRGPW